MAPTFIERWVSYSRREQKLTPFIGQASWAKTTSNNQKVNKAKGPTTLYKHCIE